VRLQVVNENNDDDDDDHDNDNDNDNSLERLWMSFRLVSGVPMAPTALVADPLLQLFTYSALVHSSPGPGDVLWSILEYYYNFDNFLDLARPSLAAQLISCL
jgi:hypothetical protein